MIEFVFPPEVSKEKYLKTQMELYAKYKKESPQTCDKVVAATSAFLDLWEEHNKKIEWNYIKDKPLSMDGKLRLVAFYSQIECVSYYKEVFCSDFSNFKDAYAWTDFLVIPPPVIKCGD